MSRKLEQNECKKSLYTTAQVQMAKINGFRPYIVDPGKSRYTGYWTNSKQDGFGARHSVHGLTYDGQWKDGMRHGQGFLRKTMSNGTYNRIYVGQWKYNQKCGEGKQFYQDGVYFGWWKANKRDGLGIMWYNDGSQYVGEWKNDFWHGAGVLFQENGNRYEGFFENGKKHGEGLFYHLHTGQIQKGIWQFNVCKVSMLFDCIRNQADRPTFYPIPESELLDPDTYVHNLFKPYLPNIEKVENSLTNLPCIDLVKEMKRRFAIEFN